MRSVTRRGFFAATVSFLGLAVLAPSKLLAMSSPPEVPKCTDETPCKPTLSSRLKMFNDIFAATGAAEEDLLTGGGVLVPERFADAVIALLRPTPCFGEKQTRKRRTTRRRA